jgi:hypothetical protein
MGTCGPMEQQISVERVAEIMWQRGNDTDLAVKAHLAWLALPADERQYWYRRAEEAITDWRRATARNYRDIGQGAPQIRRVRLRVPQHLPSVRRPDKPVACS